MKLATAGIRLVVHARKHGMHVRTDTLRAGEHRHVWSRGVNVRRCTKCGMQQRRLAGMWL